MINDVLDLSKIEAGAAVVSSDSVDLLDAVMAETVATVKPAAAANGATITVEAETSLGVIDTDGFKLSSQCLLNLMSNAAKFTKGRPDQIGGRARCDWVTFQVIDTGIGISPDAQTRLFSRWCKPTQRRRGATSGTGLSLAITRRLARLLGGDVTLKSAVRC